MIIMAMAGAFWAYDAWINITYLSGEIKDVQKNLPRAMAITVLIVIAVYVLINLAYIYIIPVPEMAAKYSESYLVAVDVAASFLGKWGGGGHRRGHHDLDLRGGEQHRHGLGPGLFRHGPGEALLPPARGRSSPASGRPGRRSSSRALWASVLVFSGTFDQLTDMLIFVSWMTYALAAASVFILRRKMPDAPRPYKVWGYPVTPVLFVVFASVYLVFTLYSDITAFAAGTGPDHQFADGAGLGGARDPGIPFLEPEAEREDAAAGISTANPA